MRLSQEQRRELISHLIVATTHAEQACHTGDLVVEGNRLEDAEWALTTLRRDFDRRHQDDATRRGIYARDTDAD